MKFLDLHNSDLSEIHPGSILIPNIYACDFDRFSELVWYVYVGRNCENYFVFLVHSVLGSEASGYHFHGTIDQDSYDTFDGMCLLYD